MISATESLARLRQGNQRFVEGVPVGFTSQDRPLPSAKSQEPFAVILGCSDSRVPTEIIFDQGPGDLFVIRVAGNIVAPSQIASVEFATEYLGARLVVVLGHAQCGAVTATLKEMETPGAINMPNLKAITDHITPALVNDDRCMNLKDEQARLARAISINVDTSMAALKDGSSLIAEGHAQGRFLVVGAEYSLETGVVRFR